MVNKLERLKKQFYFKYDGTPDLASHGVYREGLTDEEIDVYLMVRAKSLHIKKLRNKLFDLMGAFTCTSVDGKRLVYRHDILRFADVIFEGKPTYFD